MVPTLHVLELNLRNNFNSRPTILIFARDSRNSTTKLAMNDKRPATRSWISISSPSNTSKGVGFIPSSTSCINTTASKRRPRTNLCHHQFQVPILYQQPQRAHNLFQSSKQSNFRPQQTRKWIVCSYDPLNFLTQLDRQVLSNLSNKSVIVTGGTGLVGVPLICILQEIGARVCIFARNPSKAYSLFPPPPTTISPPPHKISVVPYNSETTEPLSQTIRDKLASADVVINLAGEPIADGRWTVAKKAAIYDSRVNGTTRLVSSLQASNSSAILVSASAVGYYGTSETTQYIESDGAGNDFLAKTASAWEKAALAYRSHSRTVVIRLGVVLARNGGALEKMSGAFRAFLGGPPGGGQQWFSWVHVDDAIRLLLTAAADARWDGVYNGTAPQPVRLKGFCRELGRVLERPSWLPVPKQAVQVLLGNEAAQLVLAGQHVVPKEARKLGFVFRYKDVGSALDQLILAQEESKSNDGGVQMAGRKR